MTWILLPGMDGTGDFFAPFVASLPKEDVAVMVRYSRSQSLSRREIVRQIDESLPITGEYILLAESFSGAFAIEIASRKSPPKRCRALVLCASFAKPPISFALRAFLKMFGPLLMRMSPPAFIPRALLMDSHAMQQSVDEARSIIRSVRGHVLASRLKIVCDSDISDRLPGVKIPTLVVGASLDKLVPKSITTDLANRIPNSKLEWVDGPHFLAYSRPKEVLVAVQKFLTDLK